MPTTASRRVNSFTSSKLPSFAWKGRSPILKKVFDWLDRGKAMAVLEIPPRFHEQLAAGEPTAVQLLVDTTNSPQGLSAAGYAARIVAQFGQETALARVGSSEESSQNLPVIVSDHRVWYNPDQNETWFESISHLLRQITIFAILLPAAALVREKERGTVEQLLVSPLTPLQIMLPKVLAMTVVILCATAVGLVWDHAAGVRGADQGKHRAVFRPHGPVRLHHCRHGVGCRDADEESSAGGYDDVARGRSDVVAVRPRGADGGHAGMGASPHGACRPLRYFIEIAHGILLKGVGLSILWDSVLAMVVLGAVLFGFGMWRFRRQFE